MKQDMHHQTDDFIIHGGRTLHGEITTNTSKNGALGVMCAALLNKGKTTIHGVPRIEEINRIIEVFEALGVTITWIDTHSLEMRVPKKIQFKSFEKNPSAQRIRSALMMLGALVHESPLFFAPHSGGCKMGNRTIAAHKHALKKIGVSITTLENTYRISAKKIKPARIVMFESSDTATENILIACAKIPGTSVIEFAQQNYMVLDVCYFLQKLGVRIEGIGSPTLTIHGCASIDCDVEHTISEDPIESMMFLSLAVVTNSAITIRRCPYHFLKRELLVLESMGARMSIGKPYLSDNEHTELVDITTQPSRNRLRASEDKIHALPYPGINSDNLPFFIPICAYARGTTLVHDWMWENRAIYFIELNRLGASIQLADPHRVLVTGPTPLQGNQIICPPALRPSTMILVAMLAAEGTSVLRNVYSINRGYENIVERLKKIGASIEKINT